jgi:hypothetical protein
MELLNYKDVTAKVKGQRKAPAQKRLIKREYKRKIELIPKDTYIQFRVTTAQQTAFKQILEQRGITITDYFTKIIDFEIQKDMNKNQYTLLELLESDLK